MLVKLNQLIRPFPKSEEKKISRAQITTILTLIIGLIFVFIVLMQNVQKATDRKTALDNAVDGAALQFASEMGSYAYQISQEFLGGAPENCQWNYVAIAAAIIMVVCIVALAASFLACTAFLGSLTASSYATMITVGQVALKGLVIGGLTLGAAAYKAIYIDPAQFRSISQEMKKLTAEQQLFERAMQYVFLNVVDDPGIDADINDDNYNGRFGEPQQNPDGSIEPDLIPNRTRFYAQRLRRPNLIGDIVVNFRRALEGTSGTPGFLNVTRDGATGNITSLYVPDPRDSSRVNSITDWLRGNVTYPSSVEATDEDYPWIADPAVQTSALNLLVDHNYAVYFWPSAVAYQVGTEEAMMRGDKGYGDDQFELYKVIVELRQFEDWARGVLSLSNQDLSTGFSAWYGELINDGDCKEDNICGWRSRLGNLVDVLGRMVDGTQSKDLTDRHNQLTDCLDPTDHAGCMNHWWGCCCKSSCPGAGCVKEPVCVDGCIKAFFACVEGCAESEDPFCVSGCITGFWSCYDACPWITWFGCACDRGCCSNCMFWGAASPPACEDAPCCQTCCYLKDPDSTCPSEYDIIPPYINHIQQIRAYLNTFITYLDNDLGPSVVNFKSTLAWNRELSYSWNDSRGDHTVKITIDPHDNNFTIPYLDHRRDYWIFRSCVYIHGGTGRVTVRASRYDREVGKSGLKGILDLFTWNKTVTSEATAEWGIHKTQIRLVQP